MGKQHKALTIVGWTLTVVVVGMLAFSASMKIKGPPEVVDMFTTKFGFPRETHIPIAITEAACALVFLIPRTSLLGVVLLTAYLGGAVATHVRVLDPFISPVVVGVVAWTAILLRERRLRALFPFVQRPTE